MSTNVAIVPASTSVWAATRMTALEERYAEAGLPVEIEAGPVGVVVYGPARRVVESVCRALVETVRDVDTHAVIDGGGEDRDESSATRFWAVVTFDWNKIGGV